MWDMTGKRSIDDLLTHRQRLVDAATEISLQLGFSAGVKGDGGLSISRPA
jgi:hypothetical protein